MTYVPRVTVVQRPNGRATVYLPDGQKACGKCWRRPRAPGQQWCQPCRTAYMQDRRRGKIEVLLTPEEWAIIRALRAADNL
jgi:hypothetical protein